MPFTTFVSQLSQFVNLIELAKRLQAVIQRNRGLERSLLLEIALNYKLLTVLTLSQSHPALEVIPQLKTSAFTKYLGSDISLDKLQPRRVSKKSVKGFPEVFSYEGKSTEKLITSLYEKISLIQSCLEATQKTPRLRHKVRLDVRLSYITKLHIVLLRHLEERS